MGREGPYDRPFQEEHTRTGSTCHHRHRHCSAARRSAISQGKQLDRHQRGTGGLNLDAVIVTVERREQDLQKYAGTAQAISADDTRALGINNELRNIQALVPGMSMANQEGNLEIFIRGVGSSNNTELGDPGAAPHINGAYIARPRGLGGMFYDVERVEINKGPQGSCAAAMRWPAR